MGESTDSRTTLRFDRRLRLEFHGSTITSDAGLLACRELDDALGLTETATACLQESRGGRNVQHQLVALLRQSAVARAGHDAGRAGVAPGRAPGPGQRRAGNRSVPRIRAHAGRGRRGGLAKLLSRSAQGLYWMGRYLPSGAALPAIDLSVVRGVGSSTVVPGSVGSYRPVIAGAKLREDATTILPKRGRALQGGGFPLQCGFTPLAGDTRTMKTDKKGALRLQTHLLLDRPEIDWPCRTRISCHHLVWAAH